MTTKDFNILLDEVILRINTVLGSKANEYATDIDRLHNFKLAATIQNTTQEKALLGMRTKHTVSIIDMINSSQTYSKEYIFEKCIDEIDYTILLIACLLERGGGYVLP